MEMNAWSIVHRGMDEAARYSRDAVFLVGNGLLGVRGFWEEDDRGIAALGGIYMSGVYGRGEHRVCEGSSRELCNLPNFLRLALQADGRRIYPEDGSEHEQTLDMRRGLFSRGYRVKTERGAVRLRLERFASMADIYEVWQRLTVTCEEGSADFDVAAWIDRGVTNLNRISCEPLPVQPGRSHFAAVEPLPDGCAVTLDDPGATRLEFRQKTDCRLNGAFCGGVCAAQPDGTRYAAALKTGDVLTFSRVIGVGQEPPDAVGYAAALERHCAAWARLWEQSDFRIDGPKADQGALRFNLFHLIQANPRHSERRSIGARGLSGEMYEGCIFWDTEIFQFPFFQMTDPASARRLLSFRYHTLDAARARARDLWFEGAMYPWQVSDEGLEQTGEGVGAFYAVHITADIAYALMSYVESTGDVQYLLAQGLEILTETARFWKSRVDRDPRDGRYHILAVRGPNEYDVIVDDNAYTNLLAAKNLAAVAKAVQCLQREYPEELAPLLRRLSLTQSEWESFSEIAEGLVIPRLEERKLVLEDSRYHLRRPLPMERAKPDSRRVIDSTLPYEALPLYQVTKQADVIQLMNLFPGEFTREEMTAAYDYYVPRTAHDSSLSYAPHAVMAARLGRVEEAYEFYRKGAMLDVENRQLNTVSGIHYANFGGTWQAAFYGFAGIAWQNGTLSVDPQMPPGWTGFSLVCRLLGRQVALCMEHGVLRASIAPVKGKDIPVALCGQSFLLSEEHPTAAVRIGKEGQGTWN